MPQKSNIWSVVQVSMYLILKSATECDDRHNVNCQLSHQITTFANIGPNSKFFFLNGSYQPRNTDSGAQFASLNVFLAEKRDRT